MLRYLYFVAVWFSRVCDSGFFRSTAVRLTLIGWRKAKLSRRRCGLCCFECFDCDLCHILEFIYVLFRYVVFGNALWRKAWPLPYIARVKLVPQYDAKRNFTQTHLTLSRMLLCSRPRDEVKENVLASYFGPGIHIAQRLLGIRHILQLAVAVCVLVLLQNEHCPNTMQ